MEQNKNTLRDRLLSMKEIVDNAEKQMSQLTGRIEADFDRLKKDFGFNNLEEAEAGLKKMDDDLAKRESALQTGVEKLEKSYNWEGVQNVTQNQS